VRPPAPAPFACCHLDAWKILDGLSREVVVIRFSRVLIRLKRSCDGGKSICCPRFRKKDRQRAGATVREREKINTTMGFHHETSSTFSPFVEVTSPRQWAIMQASLSPFAGRKFMRNDSLCLSALSTWMGRKSSVSRFAHPTSGRPRLCSKG
jgi:hypothetical protein